MIGLILIMALQAPATTPPSPPSAPDKASELAQSFIVEACMSRLDQAQSAQDYGAGSVEVDKRFKTKFPETAAVPVTLDGGPQGDACRVAYHGPYVDFLWTTFQQPPKICTVASKSQSKIAMSCPASKDNVGASITLERTGASADGEFTATLNWLGPRLP